jgi:hypothetical protein
MADPTHLQRMPWVAGNLTKAVIGPTSYGFLNPAGLPPGAHFVTFEALGVDSCRGYKTVRTEAGVAYVIVTYASRARERGLDNSKDHIGANPDYYRHSGGTLFPALCAPLDAKKRFQPWDCIFYAVDSGPGQFIAVGGQAGMIEAVYAPLGPLMLKMHGGLFETLAQRVNFYVDNTPLLGERLALVADSLNAFVGPPSFAVDCYLVSADPHKARLHLGTMRSSVKNHRSLVL